MKKYLARNKKNQSEQIMTEEEYLYWSTHEYYKNKFHFSLIHQSKPTSLPDDFKETSETKRSIKKKSKAKSKTANPPETTDEKVE